MGFFYPPVAATPPVGSLVAPTDLSGLLVWFDFSDSSKIFDSNTGGSTPSNGGAIGRIEDKSGNARDATQSTANNRPTYQTSVQNGLSVARFDGSNDFLGTANFSLTASISAFVVAARNWSTAAYCAMCSSAAGGNDGFNMVTTQATVNEWQIRDMMCYGKGYDGPPPKANGGGSVLNGFADNTFHIFSLILGSQDANLYIDKLVVNPLSTRRYQYDKNSTTTSASFRIGNSALGDHWNRDIAEIFIYDSILSDNNRQKAENYLATKWGV